MVTHHGGPSCRGPDTPIGEKKPSDWASLSGPRARYAHTTSPKYAATIKSFTLQCKGRFASVNCSARGRRGYIAFWASFEQPVANALLVQESLCTITVQQCHGREQPRFRATAGCRTPAACHADQYNVVRCLFKYGCMAWLPNASGQCSGIPHVARELALGIGTLPTRTLPGRGRIFRDLECLCLSKNT